MLDRLIALREEYQSRVQEAGGHVRLARLVDDLFVLPVVRVTDAAERVEVTYPTARRDLKRLEELAILVEVPDAEQITYAGPGIIDVVYGD